jgi:hypothetical protein
MLFIEWRILGRLFCWLSLLALGIVAIYGVRKAEAGHSVAYRAVRRVRPQSWEQVFPCSYCQAPKAITNFRRPFTLRIDRWPSESTTSTPADLEERTAATASSFSRRGAFAPRLSSQDMKSLICIGRATLSWKSRTTAGPILAEALRKSWPGASANGVIRPSAYCVEQNRFRG